MKLKQILKSLINENIESWAETIEKKYNLKSFFVSENKDKIKLHNFVVNKDDQGKGIGTKVMNELCQYADLNNKIITLTPGISDKTHGTTSQTRLISFYKRFGFILNKGRDKDFTLSELMYRNPKS